MSDHLDAVIAGALSGGFLYGSAQLIKALASRRKQRDNHVESVALLPARLDQLTVAGAAEAVLTMGRALDAANMQVDYLSAQFKRTTDHYETEIESLRQQIAALRAVLRNEQA